MVGRNICKQELFKDVRSALLDDSYSQGICGNASSDHYECLKRERFASADTSYDAFLTDSEVLAALYKFIANKGHA